jgi:hypothetical protein
MMSTASAVDLTAPSGLAGHALTWTGTYAWYCRFDEDVNTFEKFAYNLYELKKLKFSTEVY